VLLLFSRGTSMARLYSIAVHPENMAAAVVGDRLLEAAETVALERDCVSMRLEVRRDNPLRWRCSAATATASSRKCRITTKTTWMRCASKSAWSRTLRSRSGQGAVLPADPRFHLRPGGADDGDEGAGPEPSN
jgi:hypothetical protein